MSDTTEPLPSTLPVAVLAAQDGAEARRRGEPRDPAPYLPRYQGHRKALISPEDAWLTAYDQEDDRLRFEHSRPSFAGQDLWTFIR
jgi:hypothetical protein